MTCLCGGWKHTLLVIGVSDFWRSALTTCCCTLSTTFSSCFNRFCNEYFPSDAKGKRELGWVTNKIRCNKKSYMLFTHHLLILILVIWYFLTIILPRKYLPLKRKSIGWHEDEEENELGIRGKKYHHINMRKV